MLLSELLTKLTCGDLEGEELDEAVAAITEAPSAPRDEARKVVVTNCPISSGWIRNWRSAPWRTAAMS